jgi:hypothetical protein
MDHLEAVKTMAAERYLLRELSNEEIDAFEDHYFDCTECSQAVVDGTMVLDNGRSLVRQERRRRQPATRRWMPVAAAGLLGAVALYTAPMAMRVPALTAQVNSYAASEAKAGNDVLSVVSDPHAAERSGPETLRWKADAYNTCFLTVVDTNPSFVRYETEIVDTTGKPKGRVPLSVEQVRNPVFLAIRPLHAGQYSLVVEGISSDGTRVQVEKTPIVVQ